MITVNTGFSVHLISSLLRSAVLMGSMACATSRQSNREAIESATAFVSAEYPNVHLNSEKRVVSTQEVDVVKVECHPKDESAGRKITIWVNKRTGEIIYAKDSP
jgi:hypothetical protein